MEWLTAGSSGFLFYFRRFLQIPSSFTNALCIHTQKQYLNLQMQPWSSIGGCQLQLCRLLKITSKILHPFQRNICLGGFTPHIMVGMTLNWEWLSKTQSRDFRHRAMGKLPLNQKLIIPSTQSCRKRKLAHQTTMSTSETTVTEAGFFKHKLTGILTRLIPI